MRFCCRPAYGHVYPLLPPCRDAGHEVLFATGEGLGPWLHQWGIRAERVGISIPEADRLAVRETPELDALPREERWRIGVVVFGDVLARQTLEGLLPLLGAVSPDVVVYDELDIGAAAAAHLADVPAVAHSLADDDLFAINAYLDICPPSLQDPAASEPAERIALRPVAPVMDGDAVPGWVAEVRSRPLVYVTLGTYVSGSVGSLRATATGVGKLDVDALVTVGPDGDPSALAPLPDSVRVERFVSQGVLLPYLDAVAHHGGSGTMLGALAHGLPQLVLPHGADQFLNAHALIDS